MKVRFCSDLHTEFFKDNSIDDVLPHLPEDKETVLSIAGDLGLMCLYDETIKQYLKILSKRFKYVLYILGNHEYYNSSYWGAELQFWKTKKLPKNVKVMVNDHIIINGVVFIGTTLWTNFDNRNPCAMIYANQNMSDFKVIKKKIYDKKFTITPEEMVDMFDINKKFIFDLVRKYENNKCVIITHHAPSIIGIDDNYKNDSLTPAFYSELGNDICNHNNIIFWHFGHNHSSVDEIIHHTKLVCNPFGYFGKQENKKYNPKLVVEV